MLKHTSLQCRQCTWGHRARALVPCATAGVSCVTRLGSTSTSACSRLSTVAAARRASSASPSPAPGEDDGDAAAKPVRRRATKKPDDAVDDAAGAMAATGSNDEAPAKTRGRRKSVTPQAAALAADGEGLPAPAKRGRPRKVTDTAAEAAPQEDASPTPAAARKRASRSKTPAAAVEAAPAEAPRAGRASKTPASVRAGTPAARAASPTPAIIAAAPKVRSRKTPAPAAAVVGPGHTEGPASLSAVTGAGRRRPPSPVPAPLPSAPGAGTTSRRAVSPAAALITTAAPAAGSRKTPAASRASPVPASVPGASAAARAGSRRPPTPAPKRAPTPTPGIMAAAAAAAAAPAPAPASATPAARFQFQGIQLVDHPTYGRTAVTTQPFSAGSALLREAPLLLVPAQPDAAARRQLEQIQASATLTGRTLPGSLVARLLAFTSASKPAQAEFLASVMAPDPAQFSDVKAVQRMRDVVEVCAPHFPGHTPAQLMRALMALEVNAHALTAGAGVFKGGSKLAHTCGRFNTAYEERGGQLVQVAQRDLPAGAVLTTSYVSDLHRVMSAPARRRHLRANFLFDCGCTVCTTEPDHYRGLPCPVCLSKSPDALDERTGLLALGYALGRRPLPGVLLWHPEHAVPGGRPWRCSSCKAALEALPSVMGGAEEELEREVCDLLALSERFALHSIIGSTGRGEALHARASSTLGPRHWVTHAAALMAAEVAVASLREQVLGNERAGRTVPEVVASVELWVGGVGQWLGSLPPFPDTRHTDVLPGYASVAAGGAAGGRKGAPQPERMRSPTSADAGGGGAEGQEGERADAVSGLLLSLAEPLAAVVDLARTPGSQLGRYGGAGVRREVVGSARLIKLVGWLAGNAGLTWEHTRSWPNPAQQLKTVDKLQHWLTAQHEK